MDAAHVAQHTALDHGGDHLALGAFALALEDPEHDPTVVDQHRVAGLEVVRQPLVLHGDPAVAAGLAPLDQRDLAAGLEGEVAPRDAPGADLGPAEILEESDRFPEAGGDPAQRLDALQVLLVGPVAEVQPGHVEPGPEELLHALLAVRCRTDGTDDFGTTPQHAHGHGAYRLHPSPQIVFTFWTQVSPQAVSQHPGSSLQMRVTQLSPNIEG